MIRTLCGAVLAGLTGCASLRAESPCPAPGQQPMVVTELFFGRDIRGRQPLTEREWSDFAGATIAKEFPDGFTALDGEGQWLDPHSHAPVLERSKIVIAAAARGDDLAGRIARISDAYRTEFRQESVGVLTYNACGGF